MQNEYASILNVSSLSSTLRDWKQKPEEKKWCNKKTWINSFIHNRESIWNMHLNPISVTVNLTLRTYFTMSS